MIGVFDSGLGGLSVVRRVRERLPNADVVFFADQAHVPYGERTTEDLHGLLRSNLQWLNAAGVCEIVMGCNTSCAVAQELGWPDSDAPVLDLIESAALAVEAAGAKSVGVIATTATVRTGAYTRTIAARLPATRVAEVAAPALVPLVESGKAGTQEAHEAVAAVCRALPPQLDAVVLACTHYPMLDAHFADALGSRVLRIDPALVHAGRVRAANAGSGQTTYVTNGDLELFRTAIHAITGEFDPKVRTTAGIS